MAHGAHVIAIVLVFLAHKQVRGTCSYGYAVVPPPVIDWCNPRGVDLKLTCGVYDSRELPTVVTWYRSQDETLAGEVGVPIVASPMEYTTAVSLGSILLTVGDFAGTYLNTYTLTVLDFAPEDDGYYWCQLFLNGSTLTPLAPSSAVYVVTNDSISEACLANDIRYLVTTNVCVQDTIGTCCSSLLYSAVGGSRTTVERLPSTTSASTPSTLPSTIPSLSSSSMPSTAYVHDNNSAVSVSPSTVLTSSPVPLTSTANAPACCNRTDLSDSTVIIGIGVGSGGGVIAISFCTVLSPCLILYAERRKRQKVSPSHQQMDRERYGESATAKDESWTP